MRVARVGPGVTSPLQRAVLRAGAPPDTPVPGDTVDAVHLAAHDGDTLVGTATVLDTPFPPRPDAPAALLRGMAVAPDRQGSGVGALLLGAVERVAAARGDSLVWCHARTSARGFYARAGYAVEGAEFVVAELGIPHVLMWRAVEPERTPTSSDWVDGTGRHDA